MLIKKLFRCINLQQNQYEVMIYVTAILLGRMAEGEDLPHVQ